MSGVDALFVAIFGAFALIIGAMFVISYFFVWRVWLRALFQGFPISAFNVMAMRFRGSPPILLVDAYTALRRAGVATTIREVEQTYLDNRTRVRTSTDLVGLVKSKAATERQPQPF